MARGIDLNLKASGKGALASVKSFAETKAEAAKTALTGFFDRERPAEAVNSAQTAPGEVDALANNVAYEQAIRNTIDPGLTQSDFGSNKGSVVGAGYSGKNFTMPTFAAGGVEIPYAAVEKTLNAKAAEKAADAKAQLSLDYDIAETKDDIRNIIMIDKQDEYYNALAQDVADTNFGGDVGKAYAYLNQEKNTLKTAGRQWSSFSRGYDQAFDNYMALKQDPATTGRGKFSDETRKLIKEFETTIANPENFDFKKIGEYNKFITEFNQQSSIAELTKLASDNLKPAYDNVVTRMMSNTDNDVIALKKTLRKDFDDNFAETALELYADGNYSEKQQDLFKEGLYQHYEKEIVSSLMALDKFNPAEYEAKNKKEANGDGTHVDDYTVSPTSTTGNRTGTSTPGTISGTNVVTIPAKATTKPIQVSFQGGTAINKANGEPYDTKIMNVDFTPRDTKVLFYATKDITQHNADGTETKVFTKGTPITDEDMQLYKNVPGVLDGKYIGRKRFVEGEAKEVRNTTDPGQYVEATTVLVPYEDIASDMNGNFKALPTVISQFGNENQDVVGSISVSKMNTQFGVNLTWDDYASDPQYSNYLIIDK